MGIRNTIDEITTALVESSKLETKWELQKHLENNRPEWTQSLEKDWVFCCNKAIQRKLGKRPKEKKQANLDFGFDDDYTH